MRDDSMVADLVTRARHGDQQAWNTLVGRYAPLVWSICRRYRLSRADTDDVSQTVWLSLVAQLDQIRDPTALAGWLATTTSRECGKACRAARPFPTARREPDTGDIPDGAEPAEALLLAAERRAALRQAFTCLPPACRQLLAMLTEDPPVPYAQISARLGIPVGSIGPTRRRCLHKLRDHPAIAALLDADTDPVRGLHDRAAPALVRPSASGPALLTESQSHRDGSLTVRPCRRAVRLAWPAAGGHRPAPRFLSGLHGPARHGRRPGPRRRGRGGQRRHRLRRPAPHRRA